jgi:ParB family chromosome partitioning protein
MIQVDEEFKHYIPRLRDDERHILETSILSDGCKEPLVIWMEEGVLLDGHNRMEICEKHGIDYKTREVSLPDREAALAWIEDNQLGRRNLTPESFAYYIGRKYDRAKKAQGGTGANQYVQSGQNVQSATADTIASEHGIDEKTVRRNAGYSRNLDVITEVAGDEFRHSVLSGDEKITRKELREVSIAIEQAKERGEDPRPIVEEKIHNHRAQGTGVNEWYTPAEYLDCVRKVLRIINLDPATSEKANEVVQAEQIYTIDDSGLEKEWGGKVWLNPPYSQPLISEFAEKMASEFELGNIEEAIMLTHNYTDTKWFQRLAHACTAICFTRGRIGFLSPSGEKAAPTQGQAFFYFGDSHEWFAAVFCNVGFVVKTI